MFTGTVSIVTKKGSLYARGTYSENGKRKQVWRRVVSTQAAAKAEVIEEINARLSGRGSRTPTTFNDLADHYIKHVTVEPIFRHGEKVRGMNTWKQARSVVLFLKKFYGNTPLAKITRERVIDYKLYISDAKVRRVDKQGKEYFTQRSLASVNEHLRRLRTMLKYAETERWISEAPSFKKVISSAAEPPRDVYPTEAEFVRLLEKCDRPHLKAVILLIADTGARPVELWRLKWDEDVDFETGYIFYTSHKGVRPTREGVPMTKRVIAALNELPRINEYVFSGIQTIKRPWARLKRLAGVDVDLYSLRHVFATRIDNMPLSQNQKQKLMRHTSGAMFGRYAKITPVTIEDVRSMLDEFLYLPSHYR